MRLKKKLLASVVAALVTGNMANAASLSDLEDSVAVAEEAIAELQQAQEYAMDVSGYADSEFIYVHDDATKPMGFRIHHLSLFFQKKISDKWRFFSEIEFEDALKHDFGNVTVKDVDGNDQKVASGTAYGKIFVEAVSFDYQWRPEATVRVGRFFTPAGIWSIDHYPPFVSTQDRPGHIRKIFPQLTDGAMVYGTVKAGPAFVSYDAYVANGEGNTGKKDKNEEKSLGLKTNISMNIPGLKQFDVGGTYYTDPSDSSNSDEKKTSIGAHAKIRVHDFALQSEAAYAKFDTIATKSGYYAQLTYAPNDFSIGYRFDNYDSDRSVDGEKVTNTGFINYRATSNLVLKLEHHLTDDSGTKSQKTIASIAAYLD